MFRHLHDECTSGLDDGLKTRRQRSRDSHRRFRYERLVSPKDEIRLLEVHPYEECRTVRCTLTSWKRADASRRGYRALSYCWGGAGARQKLILNGKDFDVRDNLHDFLEHAARSKAQQKGGWRTGIYWIDAVCINQQDEDEKAVQLKYMSKVYRLASGTCIWLGPEDKYISPALGFIQQCFNEEMTGARRKSGVHTVRNMKALLPRLSVVLSVPYWERVWILQEIATSDNARMVSPSSQVGHIRVVCGRSEVPWSFLMVLPLLAQIHFSSKGKEHGKLEKVIRETHGVWLISWLYAAGSGARLSLAPYGTLRICMELDLPLLIYLSKHSKATMSQDYIYGLIGLMDEDYDPLLSPTMKLSGCQVLCHAMRSMINTAIMEGGDKTDELKRIARRSYHGHWQISELGKRGKRCCGTEHAFESDTRLCEEFSPYNSHCDSLERCREMARCLRMDTVLAKIKPVGSSHKLYVKRDYIERRRHKLDLKLLSTALALFTAFL